LEQQGGTSPVDDFRRQATAAKPLTAGTQLLYQE